MGEADQSEKLEFKWCKKRGVGGKNKEVQFYESFNFDGVEYTLYDSVYLYKESEPEPFIGKLIKIWENPDKSKRVKVLWFFRPCEIQNYLGAERVPENELFLASGEGKGLANVNPLDERNSQPSDEELHMAEFVFSRTFDVGQLKISDEINDRIAGIEAKFIFNKAGSHKFEGIVKENPIIIEDKKEDSRNVVVTDESTISTKLISTDERRDMEEHEKCEDGLRDACLDSKLAKDRSSSKQISPRIKADLDGSKGKFAVGLDNKAGVEEQVRSLEDLDDVERPLKKVKLHVSTSKGKEKDNVMVSKTKNDGKEKASREASITPRSKSLHLSGSVERDIQPSTKKSQQKWRLSNAKLAKPSAKNTVSEEDNVDYWTKEVTRRPDDNKNKWFTNFPWEERVVDAQKRGMLVLLWNLDPSYTSMEVEDIVWHGLKLNCTAKMIQRTAISSPHSGEAYVIFKTKEAAERALKKLDEGCLLLPNGRPLVGCIGDRSFPGKQRTFHGHLVFASPRHPHNREKEAASSHCSQPNTVEFELAIDWFLLQERWDRAWQLLFKQQGEELRKLRGSLKCK
ncbi:protein ANTI-SILENCING 1-like isoform X2 [Punica granatum]|uniref:Protein ANTI-SILENCING 1-like isoform X2 n=1 Tax=Punica granatum TaxID=22663 RepID=A0A6P8DS39_PUNGR|nr:protein ANTI-SILENCING 1-like isoform X2 [Punica granatum]